MTAIPPPMFSFPLSSGEALVLRTPSITDAYHALLVANQERLARWEPWAIDPPVLEETRSFLEASVRNWLAGLELPVVIAVEVPLDTDCATWPRMTWRRSRPTTSTKLLTPDGTVSIPFRLRSTGDSRPGGHPRGGRRRRVVQHAKARVSLQT